MPVIVAHNYRCDKEIHREFKDRIPRSVMVRDVYEQVFDLLMNNSRFQSLVVKEAETYVSFDNDQKFAWVNIHHLSKKKRTAINKGMKELVERARGDYTGTGISMTTLVTTAFALIIAGKQRLVLPKV